MSDMTTLKNVMRANGINVSSGDAYTLSDYQFAKDFKHFRGEAAVAKMVAEFGGAPQEPQEPELPPQAPEIIAPEEVTTPEAPTDAPEEAPKEESTDPTAAPEAPTDTPE